MCQGLIGAKDKSIIIASSYPIDKCKMVLTYKTTLMPYKTTLMPSVPSIMLEYCAVAVRRTTVWLLGLPTASTALVTTI